MARTRGNLAGGVTDDRHHAAARAIAVGSNRDTAALAAGVTTRQLANWLRSSVFRDLVDYYREGAPSAATAAARAATGDGERIRATLRAALLAEENRARAGEAVDLRSLADAARTLAALDRAAERRAAAQAAAEAGEPERAKIDPAAYAADLVILGIPTKVATRIAAETAAGEPHATADDEWLFAVMDKLAGRPAALERLWRETPSAERPAAAPPEPEQEPTCPPEPVQ